MAIKIKNSAVAIAFSVLLVCTYYLSMFAAIFVIGITSTGFSNFEDVYRLGIGIINVQAPWRLIMVFLVLMVFAEWAILAKKHHDDWYAFSNFKMYYAFALIILGIIINFVVSMLVNHFAPSDGKQVSDSLKLIVQNYPICLILATGIFTPILEELMFRFLMFNYLREINEWFSVLLSSLVFGCMHGTFSQVLYATVLGVVFCIFNKSYKSIMPGIIMHCSINTLSCVFSIIANGGG